jgi:hypothetical protein
MILVFMLTFLLTTAGYGVLIWFGCRRIAAHFRENPAAGRAIFEHVVLPLFKKQASGDSSEDNDLVTNGVE